jgi:lipopolysaccharide/colanic/teichoic acid biosynthesis glycosyltransferase
LDQQRSSAPYRLGHDRNRVHDYAAKARLTGLWQVSGRSMSYARQMQLEVWYVRDLSHWRDIAIPLKAVPAVILRRGTH